MKLMTSLDTPNNLSVNTGGGGSSSATGSTVGTSTNNLYECPICNLSGLTHGQLLDHSKQHANVPGKCPICCQ